MYRNTFLLIVCVVFLAATRLGADVDTNTAQTGPTIVSHAPADGATNVMPWGVLLITLDEAIDPSTIVSGVVEVRDGQNQLVPGSISWNASTMVLQFDPTSDLDPLATYSIAVNGGSATPAFQDLDGNPMASTAVWSFDTGPIDVLPPTITATVAPGPNGSGWNLEPVTVSFQCQDAEYPVPICPSPVVVDVEGAGQTVSRSVLDAAGHTASAAVTVNIDLSAPEVEIESPLMDFFVNASSVSVEAAVGDSVSGILRVVCTGARTSVSATVSGSDVTCTLPLEKGRNSITVTVVDVSERVSSSSVRVFREGTAAQLRIDPGMLTLLPTVDRTVRVWDDFGREVLDASWSSGDEDVSVVDIDDDGRGVIHAIGPGVTTAVALWQGLTTTVTVAVFDGTQLPVGTALWSLPPIDPANLYTAVLKADPDDSGRVEMFVAEQDSAYGMTTRGVTREGVEVFRVAAWPRFAHTKGGFVGTHIGEWDDSRSILARHGAPNGGIDWRFDAPGGTFYGQVLQDRPGFIYAVGGDDSGHLIDVINGDTGRLHRRVRDFPSGMQQNLGMECQPGNDSEPSYGGFLGEAVIDSIGRFVVTYGFENRVSAFQGCENASYLHDVSTYVMKIAAGGAPSRSLVQYYSTQDPDFSYSWAGPLLVDDNADVWLPVVNPSQNGVLIRLVGGASELSAPAVGSMEFVLTGPGGRVFGKGLEGTVSAADLNSGDMLWTSDVYATPVSASADGGVVALADDGSGTWYVLDSGGILQDTLSLGTSVAHFDVSAGWLGVADGAAASLVGSGPAQGFEFVSTLPWSYPSYSGNEQGQGAPRTTCQVPLSNNWRGLRPGPFDDVDSFYEIIYTYRITDPTSWQQTQIDAVNTAFAAWSSANVSSGLGIVFAPWSSGAGQNITIRKEILNNTINPRTGQVGIELGKTNAIPTGPERLIDGAVIRFSTLTNLLSGYSGYLKVALHEIGHTVGLGDYSAGWTAGGSVMNLLSYGLDDPLNYSPTGVQSCDIQRSRYAITRP